MNRDIGWILVPLVALAVLAFVLWQTMNSLSVSGAWARGGRAPVAAPDDPFVLLDRVISPATSAASVAGRDPFTTGAAPVASASPVNTGPKKPVPPPAPARPILTAIVWDGDPRALVRWQGREYSVRSGGLFDEFQVVSITRDQVVLRRGDESIVLPRKPQGE